MRIRDLERRLGVLEKPARSLINMDVDALEALTADELDLIRDYVGLANAGLEGGEIKSEDGAG